MPTDEIKKQVVNEADITDKLTEEQFQELKALSEEPADKDVMSIEDFKRATQRWRMKRV